MCKNNYPFHECLHYFINCTVILIMLLFKESLKYGDNIDTQVYPNVMMYATFYLIEAILLKM